MVVRERNHGFISMLCSVIMLIINISLNSIFIYGLKQGIEFLAYSTIISNVVAIIFLMTWIWFKDRTIYVNVFLIFRVSPHIFKQFFKRIWSFLLFAIGSITVNIRFIFWNIGYGTGTIGQSDLRISSATILGITGMFFNIFWTTFESMSATVAVYIGNQLGSNNIDQAKTNAKQLQGYHLVIGTIIGLIALIFCFITVYMIFLAGGYEKEIKEFYEGKLSIDQINELLDKGRKVFLTNIRNTLLGITVFIPMFVWFVSRSRIIAVGGLTNTVGIVEAISGILQIGWLCMICFGLVKLNVSFSWAYFIFFLADIPKCVAYEIVYHKVDWAKNITHSNVIE